MAAPMYVVGNNFPALIWLKKGQDILGMQAMRLPTVWGAFPTSFWRSRSFYYSCLLFASSYSFYVFLFKTGAIKEKVHHITHQWSATHPKQCRAYITHWLFSKYLVKTNTQKKKSNPVGWIPHRKQDHCLPVYMAWVKMFHSLFIVLMMTHR